MQRIRSREKRFFLQGFPACRAEENGTFTSSHKLRLQPVDPDALTYTPAMSEQAGPHTPDPAQRAAARIVDGFEDYNARFSDITRRARKRFERRDWKLSHHDNTARIDLYDVCLRETLARLEALLEDRVRSRPLWRSIRAAYAERIAALPDRELYKTFYNSLARRFFQIDGVAPDVEFLALEIVPTGDATCPGELRHHPFDRDAQAVWRDMFRGLAYVNGWGDLDASAAAVRQSTPSD